MMSPHAIRDLLRAERKRADEVFQTMRDSMERARVDFENARDEEARIRAQALAVVHRDMAAMWRGEHEQGIEAALREQEPANAP